MREEEPDGWDEFVNLDFTPKPLDPAPVRDAAESEPLNVWDQCDALRARVAGLEGELSNGQLEIASLTQLTETMRKSIGVLERELDAARALLAVEREKNALLRDAVRCGLRVRNVFYDVHAPYMPDAWVSIGDGFCRSRCVEFEAACEKAIGPDFASLAAEKPYVPQLRALAQPRAERETKE